MLIVIIAFEQRICAPLRGPETALPEFPDDSWYYEVGIPPILCLML
jgi:hypothetical protein